MPFHAGCNWLTLLAAELFVASTNGHAQQSGQPSADPHTAQCKPEGAAAAGYR